MQPTNIERYLTNDDIVQKINKKFISLQFEDVRYNNQYLKKVLDELEENMKQKSPLFKKCFQRIVWAGSYYKKTRVGMPEEYDLNFVIKLPFRERDIQFIADCPGYVKMRTTWRDTYMRHDTFNLEPKALKELNSFIDGESYLNQENFRNWMEGILSKVAYESSGCNRTIVLSNCSPIRIKKKSGPAFTLSISFEMSGTVDIDVVLVLAFSTQNLPPSINDESKLSILRNCHPGSRYWSAVPKPLKNNTAHFNDHQYRYWRLCFYEFEKDLLDRNGRVKLIIRFLKKLRDTQNWNIASYYIETLCLNELNTFQALSDQSETYLLFMMLQKLREAFRTGCIRHFWDENLNLLEHIKPSTMENWENNVNKIIRTIESTIANDKYAIAQYILNKNELADLKSLIDQKNVSWTRLSSSESFSESLPESERVPDRNQWNCVIL